MAGVEPDAARVRIAARAFGPRGTAVVGVAPGLPPEPASVDVAICLDVVYQLDDAALAATLHELCARLTPGGRLVLRVTVPGAGPVPWMRRWETLRLRCAGRAPRYRTATELRAAFEAAGLAVETAEPSAPGSEELWLVGVAPGPAAERSS